MSRGISSALIIIVGFCGIVGVLGQGSERNDGSEYAPRNNCYAMAVYDELLRAIEMINELTVKADPSIVVTQSPSPSVKKFLQEDYDEGIGGGGGGDSVLPSIVPMIFKVVGSALSLNSSALTENSFGIIPENLSNRITSVLGTLASSILGPSVLPKTTRPPPRRRRTRRTTTTAEPVETTSNSTSEIPSTSEVPTTETGPTTTDHLFHENSLGENPVYASAYAPNYQQTTNYPIYADRFLHILYPAPVTTTTPLPPTTTTPVPADPNSFNVALPFDYQDVTTPRFNPNNVTGASSPPPDYEEYEYEDGATEQVKVMALMAGGGKGRSSISSTDIPGVTGVPGANVGVAEIRRKADDEDDEYKDDPKIKPSLGRISKSIDYV